MNWNTKENRRFVESILALKTESETRRFLRDLLTESEIKEFATRFKAAEMLERHMTYKTIERATGFSSTTVARVSKWLNSGSNGYRTIIARLHHQVPAQVGKGLS